MRMIAAVAVVLLPLFANADTRPCAEREGTTARVLCHADRAVEGGSRSACDRAADARVRDQCYGVYAVRTGDAASCRAITGTGARVAGLRQICLSDVAIVTGEAGLCGELDDAGLRDACFLKLARDGSDPALCDRIEQEVLQRFCRR